MTTPKIADTQPAQVNMEAGKKYAWCACGRSQKQPYCDGSHKGTGIKPHVFTAAESGEAWLCMCKRTGDQPFCDGTHSSLGEDEGGEDEDGDDEDEEPSISGGASPNAPPNAPPNAAPAPKRTATEPHVEFIHALAKDGLEAFGHHGPMTAMGVPRLELPSWDDIQILTAQLATKPLLDDVAVGTELIIGPNAKKPLKLDIPLFVSDMSFGSLSMEAKVALARGAERSGTGICSGEGGMLAEEQAENSRYFYELASAQFGYRDELMKKVQAFHFKGGQAAKTGTGGHLPGIKVTAKIAEVRGVPVGEPAVSPATFTEMSSADDFRRFADRVREI
ncbi:MAG: CDGSH iron-sulfur domain-containing protein, partial [Magnetovibrio sp.]|nr:CDGSH iron-sulfur domain-containing protein [Magnetovibrio sp.]